MTAREWVHPMKRGNLRIWDGRVRQVVSVRYAPALTSSSEVRIETLSCGHEKVPELGSGFVGSPKAQHRVCFRCPPLAVEAP